MTKRLQLLWSLLFIAITLVAQVPAGYYTNIEGKNKAELKTALSKIIVKHDARSYTQLWTDFEITDKRADGKVWDMYSTADFTFGVNQDKGGGGAEGSFYNREHSFPKSWFNDDTPMYTDLFHLYPTDKVVNNRRSNFPFGETNGEMYKSKDGFSKLGASTFLGYPGTVFEPADEYKGDFARTYFYMVTCYEDKVPSWNGKEAIQMLNQTTYPCFQTWALNLLLKWSRQDPVSPKEINRNNAVYGIQHNRNPFIDYPQLVEYIWGTKMSDAFVATGGTDPVDPVKPVDPEKPTDSSTFEVTPIGYSVKIKTKESAVVYVYSIAGKIVAYKRIPKEDTIDINSKGTFLVKIVTPTTTVTKKVQL